MLKVGDKDVTTLAVGNDKFYKVDTQDNGSIAFNGSNYFKNMIGKSVTLTDNTNLYEDTNTYSDVQSSTGGSDADVTVDKIEIKEDGKMFYYVGGKSHDGDNLSGWVQVNNYTIKSGGGN